MDKFTLLALKKSGAVDVSQAAASASAAAESAAAAAAAAEELEGAVETIAGLESDVGDLQSDVGDLETDVGDLETELAALSAATRIKATASGAVAHFVDGAVDPMALDIAINPMQEGSGDPSPTNVRPISGWTGVTLKLAGKNIATYRVRQPDTVYSGSALLYMTPLVFIPSGTVLTLSFSATATSKLNTNTDVLIYYNFTATGARETFAETTKIDLIPGTEYTLIKSSANGNITTNFTDIQLEFGNAVTDYEAPSGASYSITLPAGAGTVYGGTLHINEDGTGALTVDRDYLDLSTYTWNKDTDRYRLRLTAYHNDSSWNGSWQNIRCNALKVEDSGLSWANRSDYSITNVRQNYYNIDCKAPAATYADAAAWKAFLSDVDGNGTHAMLCIERAPADVTTYTFTAAQISSLFGENNVWADTGDVTAEYTADTKTYIERLTQPDADFVADAGIENGAYFMVGNRLFVATAAIENGHAITPGTNCTETNLAAALNALNA